MAMQQNKNVILFILVFFNDKRLDHFGYYMDTKIQVRH